MGSTCSKLCGEKDDYENFSGGGQATNPNVSNTQNHPSTQNPDPETRRRQLAEAAEKRIQQAESKGIKDPEAVRRMKKRTEDRERAEEEMARRGQRGDEATLQWAVT